MDLIDFVLEEGEARVIGPKPAPPLPQNINRETNIQNGVIPIQFLNQPLINAQSQSFSHLRRLLPHP